MTHVNASRSANALRESIGILKYLKKSESLYTGDTDFRFYTWNRATFPTFFSFQPHTSNILNKPFVPNDCYNPSVPINYAHYNLHILQVATKQAQ